MKHRLTFRRDRCFLHEKQCSLSWFYLALNEYVERVILRIRSDFKMDTTWYKSKLIERREQLVKHQSSHDPKQQQAELSNYDNHPADNATDLFDREKDEALFQHAEHELHAIDDALEKIDHGTYGFCEVTGEPIPEERLKAYPEARTVASVAPQSVPTDRPVEEEVVQGFEAYNKDHDEDETEFDGEDAYQAVARFNDTSLEYDEETGDTDLYGANGVEDFEGFLSTGIDGYHGPDSVTVEQNEHYSAYRKRDQT